jgi:mRNA interferase RelE/StbE
MDAYKIEWKRSAFKDLNQAPKDIIIRLVQAVGEFANNPFPVGVRKLSGSDHYYRIRVGDFRAGYSVYPDRLMIEIGRIGHRKDVTR